MSLTLTPVTPGTLSLTPPSGEPVVSYLLQEDDVGRFLLEDGTGALIIDAGIGPLPTLSLTPVVVGSLGLTPD